MLVQYVHTPIHEHPCPCCGHAFEMQHVVDMHPKQYAVDANGEAPPGPPKDLRLTLACPNCGVHTDLTFPLVSVRLDHLWKEAQRDGH